MAGLFALIGLLVGGGAMLHDAVKDADCRSTPYRTTRDGKPVSLTRKGDYHIGSVKYDMKKSTPFPLD